MNISFHNKNKGFTLVELIFAAGILSALSLAGTHMVKNMLKASKEAETKNEIILLTNYIGHILIDEAACTNTLSSLVDINASSEKELSAIFDKTGNERYKKFTAVNDVVYGGNLVEIEAITLKTVYDDVIEDYVAGNIPISGHATIEIILKKHSSLTGQNSIIKRFTIGIETDGSVITRCATNLADAGTVPVDPEDSVRLACESIGGSIVTVTGNDLCIMNKLYIDQALGLNFGVLDNSGNFSSKMTITPNGNVGIGTTAPDSLLDVNGSIKLSDHPNEANCKKGEVWFDTALAKIRVCQSDSTPVDSAGTNTVDEFIKVSGPVADVCEGPGILKSVTCCADGYKVISAGHRYLNSKCCPESKRFLTVSEPMDGGQCWKMESHCFTHKATIMCQKQN